MKKLYASLCAVALASLMTMGAKTVGGIDIDFSNPIPAPKALTQKFTKKAVQTGVTRDHNALNRTPSRAPREWKEVGEAYFEDGIFGSGEFYTTLEQCTTDPGLYRIPAAWSNVSENPEPFVFDATNPDLVLIEDQYTGVYSETFHSEALIFSYSFYALTNGFTEEEFLEEFADQNITLKDGILNIPSRAILMMFPDSDLEDEDGPINEAMFYGNEIDMVVAFPGSNFVPPYKTLGIGEYKEGLVAPFFGYYGEKALEPYEVTVQEGQVEETQGMLRIPDAWYVFGLANPLYLDITTPECVKVPIQYFTTIQQYGAMYFFSYSYYFVGDEEDGGISEEDFIATYPDNNIALVDGVITFPNECILYFFPQYDKDNFYTSKYTEPGYLILPESGINDIVKDIEGSAVYYNLQGIQVTNPTPGSIYIKKEGSKVSKVIVR